MKILLKCRNWWHLCKNKIIEITKKEIKNMTKLSDFLDLNGEASKWLLLRHHLARKFHYRKRNASEHPK